MTEFSRGMEARVNVLTQRQQLLFPRADLARVEPFSGEVSQEKKFKRRYYEHKIASLLFPNNFIHVVAVQGGEQDGVAQSILYSQLASVPERHAVFTAHMQEVEYGKKIVLPNCRDCSLHNIFHKVRRLQNKAEKAALSLIPAGIFPPFDDPSDYCLSTAGTGIIFFEIDAFDADRVASHIAHDTSVNGEKAKSLLERYRALE